MSTNNNDKIKQVKKAKYGNVIVSIANAINFSLSVFHLLPIENYQNGCTDLFKCITYLISNYVSISILTNCAI